MTTIQALSIVLDLAEQNVLTKAYAGRDPILKQERQEQLEAMRIVTKLWKALNG